MTQEAHRLTAESILSSDEEQDVMAAIAAAERVTSGEIRVHLSNQESLQDLASVMRVFKEMGMHKTRLRNAVLIFVTVPARTITIVGDQGIHDHVHDAFWEEARDVVISHFVNGDYCQGLVAGIHFIGEALKAHYPYQDDDIDELPNELSRS